MRTGIRRISKLAAAAGLAVLAACSYPTPYQPAASPKGTGYTTQRLESNRFRVSFKGNAITSRQTVDTYMLYRCAEVTAQAGYDYFIIVNKDVDKNTMYETYGDDLAWGWGGGWGWRHGWGGFGMGYEQARPISSYDAIADIVALRGRKPVDNPYAYDAQDVLNAIGPTIVRMPPDA